MVQRGGMSGLSPQVVASSQRERHPQTLLHQAKTYSFRKTLSSTPSQRNTSRSRKPVQNRLTSNTRRSPLTGGAVVRDEKVKIAASSSSITGPYTPI
ncbi:hypothetical protein DY000_02009736 [Brassica cretica]|uniref:Uncharacterized protein n=1 Tax=Brassica cretica TaxID=69181 RepID=A0ABQ7C6I3_BRACR|nr:hypothetical protein DY000_02009737 [Brassica cretica]KAF3546914.1 hypothetical protein DY000_02009736 [Brassica cretica]